MLHINTYSYILLYLINGLQNKNWKSSFNYCYCWKKYTNWTIHCSINLEFVGSTQIHYLDQTKKWIFLQEQKGFLMFSKIDLKNIEYKVKNYCPLSIFDLFRWVGHRSLKPPLVHRLFLDAPVENNFLANLSSSKL